MAQIALNIAISAAISATASYLLTVNSSLPTQERGKLEDLRVTGSSYGVTIPQVWGRGRLGGNVIWAGSYLNNGRVPTGTAGAVNLRETVDEESQGGKGGSPRQTTRTFTYYASFAVALCRGPVSRVVRIWAEDLVIYDADADGEVTQDDITVHLGDEAQLPDATIETFEGAGNVPAYRGLAYVVFDDLDLTRWGGRLPSLSFEVETAPATVASVLADVAGQVGLSGADDFDFSAAAGIGVTGFGFSQRSAASEVVAPLLGVYAVEVAEIDGELRAIPRGGAPVLTLSEDDLGVREWDGGSGGGDPPAPVQVQRRQGLELPVTLDLRYFDAEGGNYDQATEHAVRFSRTDRLQEAKTVDSRLVMASDDARGAAEMLLYDEWVARTGYEFAGGPRLLRLAPGDVVLLPSDGGPARARVQSVDIDLFGLEQRFRAVADDAEVLTQSVSGGGGGAVPPPSVPEPAPTTFTAWSGRELRDQDGTSAGFYVAATGPAGWNGANVYYSPDGGTTWVLGGAATAPAVFGEATTALADYAGAPDSFDLANTVDVLLSVRGSLASASQAEVDASARNAVLLGGEIAGFAVATPLGGLAYRLGTIKRGRRGTPMTGHAAGERFVLLTGAVARVSVAASLVGQTVPVKLVGAGESLGSVAAQDVVIAAPNRPYATPEEVEAVQAGVDALAAEIVAAREGEPSLDAKLDAIEASIVTNSSYYEPVSVIVAGEDEPQLLFASGEVVMSRNPGA